MRKLTIVFAMSWLLCISANLRAASQEPEIAGESENAAAEAENAGEDDCTFFREYYINSIRSGLAADREHVSAPFSELDTAKLAGMEVKYSRCPEEPEFAGIISSIGAVRRNMAVYESAERLISADGPGFTADTPAMVDSVLNTMTPPLSAAQGEEIASLRKVVEIYPSAVDKFKALIGDLRYQLDREGSAASPEYAKSIQSMTLPAFMKQEENRMANDYKYRIARVPLLKSLYDEWLERLKKNYLDPRAVAIEEQVLLIDTGADASDH